MSVLGTHELTAGIGMGLEPPLSPPVVQGPNAQMSQPDFSDLPTPPPAIRPPESAMPTPDPMPTPGPEQSQPEPVVPLQPAVQPVQAQPEAPPALEPEPILPAMAPEPVPAVEAPAVAPTPVHDYFSAPASAPEPEPVEQAPAEPVQMPELEPIPLVAPEPPEAPAAEVPPLVAPAAFEATPEPELIPEIPVAEIVSEPEPAEETAAVELPAFEQGLPELENTFARSGGPFRVVVRLRDSDRVEIGEFRNFGTAMEGAQEVIDQLANATDRAWPFYAGRFIRPDLIVSVDVVEGERE